MLGGITGILAGILFGIAVHSRLRRWIAMGFLVLGLAGAYHIGGWPGGLVTLGIILATMFLMAAVTRGLYGNNEWQAFSAHMRILFGLTRGFQIVGDGHTIYPQGTGPFMGPRIVIIRPHNAVVFELGGVQSRISGPDVVRTKRFEYVATVYLLAPQQKQLTLLGALTSDSLQTDVYYEVTYGINLPLEARTGARKLTASEMRMIATLHGTYSNWTDHVLSEVESKLRREIRRTTLSDLLDRSGFHGMSNRVQTAVTTQLAPSGLLIHDLVIKNIVPKEEIRNALERLWTDQEQAIMDRRQAVTLREALLLMADAYQVAKETGMQRDEIAREVLRQMLQQLVDSHPESIRLAPDLRTLLDDLIRLLRM